MKEKSRLASEKERQFKHCKCLERGGEIRFERPGGKTKRREKEKKKDRRRD